MLERGQPPPGGEVPPTPQGLRRGGQGRQGDRGHRADPGDGHEPMRGFVRLGPLDDLTIQIRNLLVQPTKRMVGRWAASQIASASVALFFWRFTKGLTYAGGISRTACPSMPISRAQ